MPAGHGDTKEFTKRSSKWQNQMSTMDCPSLLAKRKPQVTGNVSIGDTTSCDALPAAHSKTVSFLQPNIILLHSYTHSKPWYNAFFLVIFPISFYNSNKKNFSQYRIILIVLHTLSVITLIALSHYPPFTFSIIWQSCYWQYFAAS